MHGQHVLIAGCGTLGQALGRQLASEGAVVYGLRRRTEGLPEAIHPVQTDLMAPAGLSRALPERVDRVYFILTPPRYDGEGYRDAFVRAQGHLIHALETRGHDVQRWVFVSSTSVYGQSDGEWIDEDSPTHPLRETGSALLEGEQCARRTPWPSAIVRFGGIYGGGRDMLIRKVLRGDPCHPHHYTNRIHQTDCVRALAHLGRTATPPDVYLGVDDEPATQCAVLDEVARLLDRPSPERDPDGGASTRAGSKRCRNTRLRGTGFSLCYPTYREGYAAELVEGATRWEPPSTGPG